MNNGESVVRPLYRSDIDGLRGVAVLAVVFFHAFPGRLRGGFVGVDVFFVISGYLITSLIVGSLEESRFSFADFYARRIRRIFPALILILVACLAAGWFLLFAWQYSRLARHVVGGAAFVANFVLWSDTSYFDPAADTKPLLHLWSLGIEEQFYFLWPLVLVVAWRVRCGPRWPALVVLVASFALNIAWVRSDPVGDFYSPLTRIWELLLGAALVGGPVFSPRRPVSAAVRNCASVAGIVLIAAAAARLDRSASFPGWWALLPTGGSALLIAAGPDAWLNRVLLARRALVGIGLVSYPLYLWHWPILSFATVVNLGTPPTSTRAGLIVISMALAWGTYRLVERPIRRAPHPRWMVPSLCTAVALVASGAAATYASMGFPQRAVNLSDRARFLRYYEELHQDGLADAYWSGCDLYDWHTHANRPSIDDECIRRGDRRTILLWGDSYAQALSLGIRRMLPEGVRLSQVTASACYPSQLPDKVSPLPGDRCAMMNSTAAAAIRQLQPDLVMIAQMHGHEATNWQTFAAHLRSLGASRVVVVGPFPRWEPSLPAVIAAHYWGLQVSRVKEEVAGDIFRIDAELKRRYANATSFEYVSLVDALCNDEGCVAVLPGGGLDDLVAVDAGHLSPKGSVFVAQRALHSIVKSIN